jgi:CBS domain-containing protein
MVARHLMSAPVVSVRADSSVAEAAALMRERRIHRVVVTALEGARERPVGILSATDLVGRLGRLEALPKEGP